MSRHPKPQVVIERRSLPGKRIGRDYEQARVPSWKNAIAAPALE